ncbi:hypothetical protein BC628DRAFT_1333433 [Trametes gibbosa]|nr:hypothetical protein BC628DRAFT_1333433 [Trametes gibbosa]
MSLKIKISKNSVTSESRPVKRRKQRIDSDDEGQDIPYEQPAESSRRKKAHTLNRIAVDDDYADADEDVDVDIDGDIEDTRFLPEPLAGPSRSLSPAPPAKRRLSNATGSSSKARAKESKLAKTKSSTKRSRRAVVWTDDEDDDEFDDPDVVMTDDDDFDPEPGYRKVGTGKGKSGKVGAGKIVGKTKAMKEEKEIVFRDERKLPAAQDSSKRPRPQEEGQKNTVPSALDLVDEVSLPKKRKLPTIKKNKPSTAGSTAPSTPSVVKPVASVPEKTQTLLTPAPTSNQVGARKPAGASADLNLLDSSVYSELFKSKPGLSAPNSGLNRKQKEEERKKELHRMRDEARAKREAESENAFDLQAAPDKVERFVLHRLRHSTARFPNVLGATFKEMYDRSRATASTAQPR